MMSFIEDAAGTEFMTFIISIPTFSPLCFPELLPAEFALCSETRLFIGTL